MRSNLEIIHELYRAFKEKDDDAFRAICDENIQWNQNPGFPKGKRYLGAEDVIRKVFQSFDETWDEWRFEIGRFYDAGESVVVTGLYRGRHKKTGKIVASEAAHFYALRNGKVVQFQQYADSKVIWDAMT